MRRQVSDGWHTILGNRVYVKDGYVVRGVRRISDIISVPTRPFSLSKYDGFDFNDGMTVDNFRRKFKNGTAIMA